MFQAKRAFLIEVGTITTMFDYWPASYKRQVVIFGKAVGSCYLSIS